MFDVIAQGAIAAVSPLTLAMTVIGVVIGIVIAAIPGLTVTMAVAVLLPFTFYMSSAASLGLLIGTFVGGMAGGAISSILINIPGNPASIVTNLDGYPLAQKGRADLALGTAFFASVLGGAFSLLLLILVAPQIANIALLVGAVEQTTLVLLGLTLVAGFSEGSLVRGLISAGIGLVIGTVGLDPITANARFTFGSVALQQGLSFVPIMIGMFALPSVIEFMCDKVKYEIGAKITMRQALRGAREAVGQLRRIWPVVLKSSIIGTVIGAIPGTGSAIAAVLSYRYAERTTRERSVPFGKGNIEGIAAPEAANSAMTGGALIPMLVLGIPGDPITAVMLGALIIHGLTPGVTLFTQTPEIVYGLFASFGVSLILLSIVGAFGIPIFVKTVAIPMRFLMAVIVLLSVVGAYTIDNSLLDVWIMLASGIFAYYFRRWGYPLLPMLLALILGKILEEQFRMSLIIALGNPLIFLMKPLSLLFVCVFVAFLSWKIWQTLRTRSPMSGKPASST